MHGVACCWVKACIAAGAHAYSKLMTLAAAAAAPLVLGMLYTVDKRSQALCSLAKLLPTTQ